jgi:flagellar hook-associated protein FlgK
VQKRLDTIAMGLVKVANSAAQTTSGTATSLAIFGFKVADKTYSSLASNDLTGQLPTIENENDLLDLYSSLGNAISSYSAVKVGSLVGTYTSISSLTAGSTTSAGDYTLTKVGTNQLNISNSSGKNQTVSLSTSVSGGLQTVDFNQLGITLQLENFSPSLSALSPLSGTTSSVNTTNGSSGLANEIAAITIGSGGLSTGQSLTIAGLTFTAIAPVTQAQLGAAFANLANNARPANTALGNYTGNLTGFSTGALSLSNVITATSITANQNVDNLTITVNGSGGGVASSVLNTNGNSIPAANETADITIGAVGLTAGQSLTIAGLTFTATTTVTQAQLGAAFENLTSGAVGASAANAAATALLGTYNGTLAGFDTGALSVSNVITATSTTLNSDVSDISVTTQAFSVGIKNNVSLPIGGPASQRISNLVIQNNVQAAELNFTSNGDNLTLTSSNGGSQTITVLPGAATGQSFNFDQMGISFSVTDIGSPVKTAAEIAGYFNSIRVSSGDIKSGTTLPTATPTQSISNMVVQGSVKAGAYTFSATGASLTLSNGSSSQTITVLPGVAAGQSFNFDQLGISFLVSDTSLPAQTAATIAGYFDTKKLQVSAGITLENAEDSQATIATALDGLKVKVSGMSNPLVNYGLTAANFVSLAPTNFASYFNGNTPLITSEKANATQQMSTVFGTSISNLVNEVGVQVAIWKNGQKADSVVLANLKAQRDSVSGVNLDEEAANLLKYQQLYTASTKVLQAGNQMFSTLLSIMN